MTKTKTRKNIFNHFLLKRKVEVFLLVTLLIILYNIFGNVN